LTAVATVRLPAALVALFPGAPRRVEVEGTTVAAVLNALDARWPGMRDRLCDGRPALRRHITIFVDGERAALDTEVGPQSEVDVIPAISGG
jgi:molybdopterin converting factor small subunit